jgi:hypothetical protein
MKNKQKQVKALKIELSQSLIHTMIQTAHHSHDYFHATNISYMKRETDFFANAKIRLR